MIDQLRNTFSLTGRTEGVPLRTLMHAIPQKNLFTVGNSSEPSYSVEQDLDPTLPFLTLWALFKTNAGYLANAEKTEYRLNLLRGKTPVQDFKFQTLNVRNTVGESCWNPFTAGDVPVPDGVMMSHTDPSDVSETKIAAPFRIVAQADRIVVKLLTRNLLAYFSMVIRQSNINL